MELSRPGNDPIEIRRRSNPLVLRFDQCNQPTEGHETQEVGCCLPKRSERQVRHRGFRNKREDFSMYGHDVCFLQHDDPIIPAQPIIQLVSSRLDRANPSRAVLEQTICESTGGSSRIEEAHTRDVELPPL